MFGKYSRKAKECLAGVNMGKKKEEKDSCIPTGGILAVIGGFLIQLTLGSYYSFANMMPYMVSYMRRHSDDATNDTIVSHSLTYGDFIVVQSAWGITQGLVLPVAGAVVALIGVRKAVLIGSILFAVAPVITSFTLKLHLWLVVLSYGVLSSVGQNLAILPTLTVPMDWFPRRKGLVSGIVVSGFGMGAFIFNQIQTFVINPRDLPVAKDGSHDGYFITEEILQRVPLLLQCLGLLYGGVLLLGSYLLLRELPRVEEDGLDGPEAAGRAGLAGVKKVMSRREFYLLWLSRFGMVLIAQGLSGFYKAFALEELGYGDEFVSKVGAIAGIFNCVGRLSLGFLVDKISYRTLMSFESVLVLALLSTFFWTSGLSQYAFAAALWLSYLAMPGVFAMQPAVCSLVFGPGLDLIAIGLVGSSDVVNNLILGVFSNVMLREFGWAGYFVGISLFAVVVLVATLLFPTKVNKLEKKGQSGCETLSAKVACEEAKA